MSFELSDSSKALKKEGWVGMEGALYCMLLARGCVELLEQSAQGPRKKQFKWIHRGDAHGGGTHRSEMHERHQR